MIPLMGDDNRQGEAQSEVNYQALVAGFLRY